MNSIIKSFFGIILLFTIPVLLTGQSCESCFKEGDCKMDIQKGYKIYSQSKGYTIGKGDTLEMNVVFYGHKDYVFTFCTEKTFYPVHFTIIEAESGTVIYDNKEDRYIESLGIGFNVTRNLNFKINVLADKEENSKQVYSPTCLGVLFQYKNYKN